MISNKNNKELLEYFFNFMTHDENKMWCIGILNYKISKSIATKYKLPYNLNSVFIKDFNELFNVVNEINKVKVGSSFKLNPQRKSYYTNLKHPAFNFKFPVYNPTYYGIEEIFNILIDIDRVEKNGPATKEELLKLNEYSNLILKELNGINIHRWLKICSGNGIHIIIPLDEGIYIPLPQYDAAKKMYVKDELFDKYLILLKKTFYEKLFKKFNTKAYREKYNAEIDNACWKLTNGCAIPYTFNIKYNKQLRYIVNSSEGSNEGLADAIFNQLESLSLPVYNKNKVTFSNLKDEFKLNLKKLEDCRLVKFLLSKKLPSGMRNNYLIFQLKLLLKDNGISFNEPKVKELFMKIDKVQGDNFAWNIPDDKYHFNPDVVNKYCIVNRLPLLYDVMFDRKKVRDIKEYVLNWDNYKKQYLPEEFIYKFNDDSELVDDLKIINKRYNENPDILILYGMIKGLEDKYGSEDVRFILENYVKYYIEK